MSALALALTLTSSLSAAAGPEQVTVLVLGVVPTEGVSQDQAGLLDDRIGAYLGLYPGFDVTTSEDVRNLLALEAEREALGCSDESSCLTEVAGALGAELVLTGRVGYLGEQLSLTISLLDALAAKTVSRQTLEASSAGGLLEQLPDALDELVGKEVKERGLPPIPLEEELTWYGPVLTGLVGIVGVFHIPLGLLMFPVAGVLDFGLWNLGINNFDGQFSPFDFVGPFFMAIGTSALLFAAGMVAISLLIVPWLWWTTPDPVDLLAEQKGGSE